MEEELEFARAFIRREKRERYLSFLASPRRRAWVIGRLAHTLPNDLDLRYASRLPRDRRDEFAIEDLLRARGAPDTCHMLSENRDLDGRRVELAEAIWGVLVRRSASVLVSIPDRLALYVGENPFEEYLLERPRPPAHA